MILTLQHCDLLLSLPAFRYSSLYLSAVVLGLCIVYMVSLPALESNNFRETAGSFPQKYMYQKFAKWTEQRHEEGRK